MKTEKNTLTLTRSYTPFATLGVITKPDKDFLCYSLERAWKNNQRSVSCIPEGTYELRKRFTAKRGWHIILHNVPNRTFILIHSGADVTDDTDVTYDVNNQKVDSLGCILPQTNVLLLNSVVGSKKFARLAQANSVTATKEITELIFSLIDTYKTAYLEVTSIKYEFD
jgi:hypothetical protein